MMKRSGFCFVLLTLCFAVVLPFAVMTQATAAEPRPLEYYKTLVPNDDSAKAYLELVPYENPVYRMYFEDAQANGWHYSYSIEEVNGIPFTLTALTETMYDADGQVILHQTMKDLFFFDNLRMADGAWQEYGMRIDQPSAVRWVAYEIDGVDDSGNQQSFHCLFELLVEDKPLQKQADFTAEQLRQDGRPFMMISGDPALVYAVKNETNPENPYWWQYDMVFENAGDTAFVVSSLNEVGFNGEDVMYDSNYTARSVAGWCDEEDCVIEPGERWVIPCAMPVQNLTSLGMRLTGTDENGEEMSFTGVIEFLHEMKKE